MARPTFAKLATNPKPEPEPQDVGAPVEAEPMLPLNAPKVQKSRQGKKSLTVYLSADQVKAVRLLAVRNDRTLEDMTREALNDLLRKYGEHPTE
jgi:hypothetical protein